jgi:hypothetical protein
MRLFAHCGLEELFYSGRFPCAGSQRISFHERCPGARCAVQRARVCEVALPLAVASGRAFWRIDEGGAAHLFPEREW